MDFTLDENQEAVAELANKIFSDRIDPAALTVAEKNGEWFDKDTYGEIAKAGLLSIAISENNTTGENTAGGLGLVELGQVLEAQGRYLAPIPLMDTALGALAIDKYGTDDLAKTELPEVIAGNVILALGLAEWHSDDYLSPQTEACPDGDGSQLTDSKLTGTKIMVEFINEADKIIVSAKNTASAKNAADNNVGLYLVDLSDPTVAGFSVNEGTSTRHQKIHEVTFSDTPATKISRADFSEEDLGWFINAATACLCAIQIGVTQQAVKMSAEYTSTREQFGRPIATFQAVTHRLADQYINVNGIRLTTYAALWTLDHIDEDTDITNALATERVSEAKWFSSHLAMAVADATQHVHGGIGMDRDYPLHRYTLWNKHIQTTLGAGTQHLRRLGAQLAS